MQAEEVVVLLVCLAFGVCIIGLFLCLVGKSLASCGTGGWCNCSGLTTSVRACCSGLCTGTATGCGAAFAWCGGCCKTTGDGVKDALNPRGEETAKLIDEKTQVAQPVPASAPERDRSRVACAEPTTTRYLPADLDYCCTHYCLDCGLLNRLCCECKWTSRRRQPSDSGPTDEEAAVAVAVAAPAAAPPQPPQPAALPPDRPSPLLDDPKNEEDRDLLGFPEKGKQFNSPLPLLVLRPSTVVGPR